MHHANVYVKAPTLIHLISLSLISRDGDFSTTSTPPLMPTEFPATCSGVLCSRWNCQGVKATTHLHLAPRLRMCGLAPPVSRSTSCCVAYFKRNLGFFCRKYIHFSQQLCDGGFFIILTAQLAVQKDTEITWSEYLYASCTSVFTLTESYYHFEHPCVIHAC